MNAAVIYNFGQGTAVYYSRNFQILGSADGGVTYTQLVSGTLTSTTNAQAFSLGGFVGNRVKLLVSSGYRTNFWELSEFQVFGTIQLDGISPVPGTATSASSTNVSPIVVTYTGASDTGGSGLKTVELWFKKGAAGTWTNSGLTQTGASGQFSFTGMTGFDTYYFGLVAVDWAGNRSAPVTGNGSCSTVYGHNLLLPANGGALVSFTSQYNTTNWAASNLTDGIKGATPGAWCSTVNPGVQSFSTRSATTQRRRSLKP